MFVSRIIFISPYPWSERDWIRLSGRDLQAAGIEVRVFVTTEATSPEWFQSVRLAALESPAETIVFMNFNLTWKSAPFFSLVSQLPVKMGLLRNASQPNTGVSGHPGLVATARRMLARFRIKLICARYKIRPADFLVIDALEVQPKVFDIFTPTNRRVTKVIGTHSLDYEQSLRMRAEALPKTTSKSAVFVDQYLEGHPDYAINNTPVLVEQRNYEATLKGLFDLLAREFGYDVIFAAHPKRPQAERYAGVRVVQGATQKLVSESSLVIGHYSTGLNLAVLYRKPTLIVTTDAMHSALWAATAIESYAAAFGTRIVNLDHFDQSSFTGLENIDSTAYEVFRSKYIKTPGTPDLSWWQIAFQDLNIQFRNSGSSPKSPSS